MAPEGACVEQGSRRVAHRRKCDELSRNFRILSHDHEIKRHDFEIHHPADSGWRPDGRSSATRSACWQADVAGFMIRSASSLTPWPASKRWWTASVIAPVYYAVNNDALPLSINDGATW